MDTSLFPLVTRNPRKNLKYMILEGPRTGWVMPGSMLETRDTFTGVDIIDRVMLINPAVEEGNQVVPLRMRDSIVAPDTVRAVQSKTITTANHAGPTDEWVVLPENLPDQDRELFLLQIREHVVLREYERQTTRRGWGQYWKTVNEDAGFTLRPVPATMTVRAKWRVSRSMLDSYITADRLRDIVENSDQVVMSHVTTDHTIYLANHAAQCRCNEFARTHRVGQEATGGESFREIYDVISTGLKQRLELASIEVRAINCPLGYVAT